MSNLAQIITGIIIGGLIALDMLWLWLANRPKAQDPFEAAFGEVCWPPACPKNGPGVGLRGNIGARSRGNRSAHLLGSVLGEAHNR